MKRVHVAIPNYAGVVHWQVAYSLVRMIVHEKEVGRGVALEFAPRIRAPRVRNFIGHSFMKFDYDYLLTIDDDHIYPPEALETLLARNLDIVGALAFVRGENTDSTLTPSMYKQTQTNPPRYTHISSWEPNSLVEVDSMGMAFTLISRRVLESIPPPWWYLTEEEGLGEDFYFCWKAQQAGFKLYVDTSLEVPHLCEPILLHSGMYKLEQEGALLNSGK